MPIDRPPSTARRAGLVVAMAFAVAGALFAVSGTATAAPPPIRVGSAEIAPACPAPSPTGFCTELVGGGTAAVVDGQRGYLRFTTRAAGDRATVFAQRFGGLRLADLSDLALATFVERTAFGNDQAAPGITISIRPNRPGGFASLVWQPSYPGSRVTPRQWQQWTPSTAGGGWSVRGTVALGQFGFRGNNASFAQVKAAFPDAVVYAVGVGQGSGTAGLVAGVDQLRVNGRTYDFENPAPTADLGVSVWAQPTAPGTTTTARITVTNAGPSPARDVSTALAVSGGGRVVSTSDGVVFGQLTAFRTAVLGVGQSATYTVRLAVDPVGTAPVGRGPDRKSVV